MEGKRSLFDKIAGWGPLSFIMGKIRNKLLAAILVTSLTPLIIVALMNYNLTSTSLEEQSVASIKVIEERAAQGVKDFFIKLKLDLKALAESPYMIAAGTDFYESVQEIGNGDIAVGSQLMRNLYLDQPDLEDYDDGGAYSMFHSRYHSYLKKLTEIHQLKDIFLVEIEGGNILYSATKRAPFGTNLLTGPHAKEGMGRIFEKMKRESSDAILFEDFSYSSVFGEQTAFYATRIHQKAEEKVTVETGANQEGATAEEAQVEQEGEALVFLIVEISISRINEMMSHDARIGETDEMYLIGPEGQWRSNSRFLADLGTDSTMMNPKFIVDTQATKAGQAKKHETLDINNYRGRDVLSIVTPLVLQGATVDNPNELIWSLIFEMEHAEIDKAAVNIRNITGIIILVAIVFIVLISLLVSGGLVKQVSAITSLFGEIGMGDFDARAPILSQDELGELAGSLNTMLDNVLTLIQSQEERDAIQDSIKELLEEVALIADGDLTIEAKVKDDITGSIADSFNFMIQQLRDVIRNVQDATIQVSSSANEIQTTAEHLAEGSESQASQILDTTAAIDEMAVSIQQVSENAALSATVGEQAKVNSQQGAKSVQDTIAGMNKIRNQVQETSKRIKRLGESSQEIGDIVQLIGDIADRTSILALNASIQAAMAGDAGRGFAVVAEEVERLADRSTNATKQIDGLIKTIQSEVAEAVTAMETTTEEVVSGSQVADQAGQALVEIEGVSNRLSELIQSISLSAKQQARGSEALATSMNQIADVTQQTAAGTKQAAVSINNLAHLADELRESISTFKLPDNGGRDKR